MDLNKEVQSLWNQNAAFWDDRMGEGNAFQRMLVGPSSERLLQLRPGELVLEIACGNGVFARRMAQLGANVVATDFSEVFIERARQRTTERADRIEYRVVDAADEGQLLALGEGRFDAVVCNMAIMDMTTIEPLALAVPRLLKPGGRLVFSLTHPCFNNIGIKRIIEEEDREGEIVTTYALKVTQYANLTPAKGLGIIGQPVPQYYFDRPLNVILSAFFCAGLVMDGIEEPAFGEESQPERPFSWLNFKEIPPVLVVRMRSVSQQ